MQKSPEYADTVGIQEEGTRPDASPAQNELYADFIVKYMGNFQEDLGDVPGISFQKINSIYGVVYARDYKAAGASLSSAERAGDGHCSY